MACIWERFHVCHHVGISSSKNRLWPKWEFSCLLLSVLIGSQQCDSTSFLYWIISTLVGGSIRCPSRPWVYSGKFGLQLFQIGDWWVSEFYSDKRLGLHVELLTLVNSIWAPQKVVAPVIRARASRSHTFEPRQLLPGLGLDVVVWCGKPQPPCITTKLHVAVKKDYWMEISMMEVGNLDV